MENPASAVSPKKPPPGIAVKTRLKNREDTLEAIAKRAEDSWGDPHPKNPDFRRIPDDSYFPSAMPRRLSVWMEKMRFRLPQSKNTEAQWAALSKYICRYRSGKPKDARGELRKAMEPVVVKWIVEGKQPKPRLLSYALPKRWVFHGYHGDKRAYLVSPKGARYTYKAFSTTVKRIVDDIRRKAKIPK